MGEIAEMSGGAFGYNQYRIREIADQVKELFLTYRDRRLQAVRIDMAGRKHEERRKCRPETLRILRDAYRVLSEAAIYAQRVDWWISGDDGEENFRERLSEELDEFRREKLSLRRVMPSMEETPEDDTYCEVAKGVWTSKSKGITHEVAEKLRRGYHEQRKGKHRRCCGNCVSYSNWHCDLMSDFVSKGGICRCWTSPDSSLCRTCIHAGQFDGKMTMCNVAGGRAFCFRQSCSDYVKIAKKKVASSKKGQ